MVGRFRIRAALPADLEHIASIERIVFTDPWPESAFVPLLADEALVAESDGEVDAYVFARALGSEAEILNLAVRPEHQRRGIGRRLLGALLARLREHGASRVFLEVRRSNTGARGFYERFGFRSVGVRRGYYSRPVEDAIVLSRDLGGEGRE
jgi:ribosomal-protein-alanine N-acetyltransferase